MRKFVLAFFAVLATTVGFTSCSEEDDDTVYEFQAGTDNDANGNPTSLYTLKLNADANTFEFAQTLNATSANPTVDNYTGSFTASGTSVVLTYADGTTKETLTSDVNITTDGLGKVKTLVYDLGDGTVTLKKK